MPGFSGRGKVASHRGIRRKQKIVVRAAVVGVLGLLLEHADHRVGNSLDVEVGAHRRLSAEQLLARGIAQDDDATTFGFILLGDQPAFAEPQRAKALERGPHSYDFAVCRIELADLRNRAPQFRADVLHQIAFVADQPGVVDGQGDFAPRRQASDLGTGPSAPDDDQVLAQRLHALSSGPR